MSFSTLQLRRDTLANWTANNPVIEAGEMVLTVDGSDVTQAVKFGDGVNSWTSTPAFTFSDVASVKQYNAAGDGVTNDTAAIQAAIDAMAAGDALFFPAGTYLVSDVIKLSGSAANKTGLSFFGDHAVFKLANAVSNKNVAEIVSGSDYFIEGITFKGNKGTVTTTGTDLSYRYFNGLYIGADAGKTVSNVTVNKCAFVNNAYCGTMVGSGPVQPANITPGIDGASIANCTFVGNEVGGAGGAQRNVTYSGNTFLSNDIYGLLIDIDSVGVSVSGNTVKQLSALGAINACLFAYNADGVTFSGNSCVGGKTGILVSTGCSGASVSGNTVTSPTGSGIVVSNSTDTSVTGNTVRAAGQYGISCSSGANCVTLTGNTTVSCGFDGIALLSVSNITVGNNTNSSNNGSGILLSGSVWSNITGNVCLNNNVNDASATSSGIRVLNSSQIQLVANRCYDSNVTKKQNYGLLEEGTSASNFYAGNDFNGNKTGDALYTGTNNIVIGTPASGPQVRAPNGTAALPGLTFAGSQSTGIYRTGGGNLGAAVNGVLQFVIQAVASAVNYVVNRGGTTGNPAEVFADGADADIDLKVSGKGTGRVAMGSPIGVRQYVKASLPPATVGGLIYVSDEAGGAVLAFADSVNWRRVTDRAIVS